jgi:hypothetical protein
VPPERKCRLRSFVDGPAEEQDSWGPWMIPL